MPKIREQIDSRFADDVDFLPPKPKGMHWRTYDRLAMKIVGNEAKLAGLLIHLRGLIQAELVHKLQLPPQPPEAGDRWPRDYRGDLGALRDSRADIGMKATTAACQLRVSVLCYRERLVWTREHASLGRHRTVDKDNNNQSRRRSHEPFTWGADLSTEPPFAERKLRLTACIRELEPELRSLVDRAQAAGWKEDDVTDALAYLAIVLQWEREVAPEAAKAIAKVRSDLID